MKAVSSPKRVPLSLWMADIEEHRTATHRWRNGKRADSGKDPGFPAQHPE